MIGSFFRTCLTEPHKAFFLVGLIFGLLFVFVTPPFEVPDENAHFYYAYHISQGNLIASVRDDGAVGATLPTSLVQAVNTQIRMVAFRSEGKLSVRSILASLDDPLNPQDVVFVNFHYVAVYSAAPYIPQAFGILIARVLGQSPLVMLYMGRLANMLAALALTCLAVKTTPVAKWGFFLLSLAPMGVFERSSLSADSLTNALAILVIAIIARYAFDKDAALDRKGVVILCALSVALALSKLVYFILPALCILIPTVKYGSHKKRMLFCIGLIATGLIAASAWYVFSHNILTMPVSQGFAGKAGPAQPLHNSSLTGQLGFVLSNPLNYAAMFAGNLWKQGVSYLRQYIGVLGWLDTPLPEWLFVSFGLMLLVVALIDGTRARNVAIGLVSKLALLAMFLGVLLLTWSAVYFTVDVGASANSGIIQGRYLSPIMPLLALALATRRLRVDLSGRRLSIIVIVYVVIALTATLLVEINRYYVPPASLARTAEKPTVDVGEIVPGHGVVQQFECPVDTLRDLRAPFNTLGRQNTSNLIVKLVDGDKILFEQTVATAQLKDGADYPFALASPYSDCFGRLLRFEVASPDGVPGNAVTMPRYAQYYRGDLLAPSDVISRGRHIGLVFNAATTDVIAAP